MGKIESQQNIMKLKEYNYATEFQREILINFLGINKGQYRGKIEDLNKLKYEYQLQQMKKIAEPVFDILKIDISNIPMKIGDASSFDTKYVRNKRFKGSLASTSWKGSLKNAVIVFREGLDAYNALFVCLPHEVSHIVNRHGISQFYSIFSGIIHEAVAYKGTEEFIIAMNIFYDLIVNEKRGKYFIRDIKQTINGDVEHGLGSILSNIPFHTTVRKEYVKKVI